MRRSAGTSRRRSSSSGRSSSTASTVVVFHTLAGQTVRQIVRREFGRLLVREGIARRELLVEVDDAVVDAVAASGFHPRYGARPLQREIERRVIQPLARILLERRPQPGDVVRRGERRAAQDAAAFTKAERSAAAFAERLAEDDAAALADDVRATVSKLISTTHARAFRDEAERARVTLQRIYRLERLLGRFDTVADRSSGLVELARRVARAATGREPARSRTR
jgi:hypothetical protein